MSLFAQNLPELDSLVSPQTLRAIWDVLLKLGVPEGRLPTAEQVALTVLVFFATSAFIYVVFGRRQRKKQRVLRTQLQEALEVIERLEEELEEQEVEELERRHKENKQIRVWMDGAFDMFHYGREFVCAWMFDGEEMGVRQRRTRKAPRESLGWPSMDWVFYAPEIRMEWCTVLSYAVDVVNFSMEMRTRWLPLTYFGILTVFKHIGPHPSTCWYILFSNGDLSAGI